MVTRSDVRADVVVLTAIDLEHAAVRGHLTGLHTYADATGTRYDIGELPGGRGTVALAQTGPGNLAAAAVTGRAVAWFRPKALVFVGIAGGLTEEVSLGDVVVATRVHFYHGGRDQADGFVQRHRSFEPSHGLEQDALAVHRGGTWARLLPGDHVTTPEVHFKPIVSGEVVLDSLDGPTARQIAASYSDAVAVEMESAGVADAARRNDFIRTITVRGISDRADGTKRGTDKAGWQHRAAAHAAAFAIALAGRVAGGPGSTRPVGVSPYRGLDPFGEDDADVYFGRAELTQALAEEVTSHRLVAVVGRSGSGKSSLLRAGLVPRMRGREWATAVFTPRPEVSAAGTLAAGLLPLLRPGLRYEDALAHRTPVAQAIANGRVAEVLGDVLRTTGTARLLVCVDQFEELIPREDEARELVALLTRVATGPVPVSVVLTVRAESLDVAVDRIGLRPSVFLVTPMTTEQLREAVEAPARATGVTFEPGLQTRILDEARDAPAALTLTQFALTRLWDEQDNGRMTHHAYDAFGGVTGALASYAEQVWWERLDEAQRVQARRLLVQLVRPEGDGVVRRTARGSELAPELLSLATHLATTRLLVTGIDETGETTVDLAHAALATHWQRLRDWLAEERDFRAWQEDLRESIRRAEPLRGVRLTSALRWLRIHPDGVPAPERDFIRTSRRRHRLRLAAWRGLLVVIVGLLLVASTFAVVLNERGDQLAAQARQNAGGALVNLARARLSTNPDTAALLSVAAYRAHPEPATLANLAGEYQRYRDTDRMVDPGVGQILDMAMSADGRTVAVAGIRGTAVLRLDGERAEVTRRDGQNRQVALSPDGRMMAGVTDLGLIELWGPDGVTRFQTDRARGRPSDMRFDSTGTRLVAIMSIGGLAMWDLGTGNTIAVPSGAFDQVERTRGTAVLGQAGPRVWFGPDDTSILVASNTELTKWPLNGGPETQVLRLTDASQVLVTGDGRTAVTCADRTFEYWDIEDARQAGEQPVTDFPCPETMLETTADHTGGTVVVQSPRESVNHPRDAVLLVDRNGVSTRFVAPAPTVPPPTFASRLATTVEGVRLVSTIGSVVSVVDATAADSLPIDKSREPLISPDLRYTLNTSVWVDQLRLADTATGAEKAVMANKPELPPSARAVPRQFTVDGNRLIMLGQDTGQGPGPLEIHDVPSLTVVGTVELPQEMQQARDRFPKRFNTFCMLDLPNPREVAIIHGGQAVRVDVGAGAVTDKFPLWRTDEELERLADTVACRSRPGRAEVAFDVGKNIELWDLDRRQRTTVLRGSDVGTISSMWFTPDGRQLAVTGFDGSLEVWDVEKRRVKHRARTVIDGHLGVGLKAFPSADRVVLTSGGMLRVWDIDSNAAIADVETNNPFTATVAPDGSSLMYWGHAGLSRMPLDPRQWVDHLCRLVGRDLTDAERRDLPPGTPAEPVC